MWDNTIEKGHSQCGSSWGDHYLGMPASLHIIINKPHQDSNLCPIWPPSLYIDIKFFNTCIDLIWKHKLTNHIKILTYVHLTSKFIYWYQVFYTCIDLIWSISLQIGALLTQPYIGKGQRSLGKVNSKVMGF
jgi:hypothetical protein